MLFNSLEYIFYFLPVSLVVYFVLLRLKSGFAAKIWIVLCSLFFYGWWNPVYLVLILSSIVVNYQLGKRLNRSSSSALGKRAMIGGVIFNLSLLFYFKYALFIVDNINTLSGSSFGPFDIVLPLAISFFTFQQIAYLADCYSEGATDYSLLDYTLFVSFFPQLIAGPIVHHKEMMPQFGQLHNQRFVSANLEKGIFIFCLGLFKKVIIADTFAVWANAGYGSDVPLSFLDAWLVSLSYTFQLYFDFSGYTDMAIGAALMFNIRLPMNFNSPYKARNIQDFWARWHMTLSRWLRDYVYIPLGGNRAGPRRTLINLFLTFLIGGIWHGAGWVFLIWGALHGMAMVCHRLWSKAGLKMTSASGWVVTFLFVNFSWVFFRAESLPDAKRILEGMFGFNGFGLSESFASLINILFEVPIEILSVTPDNFITTPFTVVFVVLFGAIALFSRSSIEISDYTLPRLHNLSFWKGALTAVIAFILILASMGDTVPSEFLYFNF